MLATAPYLDPALLGLDPLPANAPQKVQYARGIRGAQPSCLRCPLRGQVVVPPEGNRHARIALVGEGPGYDEVTMGRPWVGVAGQLLSRMLHEAGLTREEVWLSNATLCLPRGARYAPDGEHEVYLSADEAKRVAARYCRYRLATELHSMRDTLRVVVPIGGVSMEALSFARRSIQARRGSVSVLDLDQFVERAYQDVLRLHGDQDRPSPRVVHQSVSEAKEVSVVQPDALALEQARAIRVARVLELQEE